MCIMLMQLACNCKRVQKKLAFRLPSAALTSAKVERILELCKFTLVHLCVFLIFCVIILLYAVVKLQSKGEETVWKGFCILTRELTHPYESVSISLCNLRSTSLNVRSTPLNVRSEPLNGGSESSNGEMIRMRKQIHCGLMILVCGLTFLVALS